jgi:competence protein ComGC
MVEMMITATIRTLLLLLMIMKTNNENDNNNDDGDHTDYDGIDHDNGDDLLLKTYISLYL